jgi:hypothetical protein
VQALPRDPDRHGGARAVTADDILSAPAGHARRPRRAKLSPHPGRGLGGGSIALKPTTILAMVLACFGVAAIVVVLMVGTGRAGVRIPTLADSVPARCTDAGLRFPGANDPRGAVVGAYRSQGVDVEQPRAGGPRLTADQAEQVIGGWMAASLFLEHAGQTAPKLTEWLDSDTDRPTLANAILAGRGLDSMLTQAEWAEMSSWPASNCEGAFLKDPRNAGVVRLIERVVTKP